MSGVLDSIVPPEGTANWIFDLVKKGRLNKVTNSHASLIERDFVGVVSKYTVDTEDGL